MKPYFSVRTGAVISATIAAMFGGVILSAGVDTARAGDGAGCFWCPKSAPFSNTTNLNARKQEDQKPKSVKKQPAKQPRTQTAKTKPAPRKPEPRPAQTVVRNESAPVGTALSANQVKAVQDCLLIIGFDPGPSDGIARGATLNAFHDFQRINEIKPASSDLDDRRTNAHLFGLCQKPNPVEMMVASAPVPPSARNSQYQGNQVEVASAPSAGGTVPVTSGAEPTSVNVRLSLANMKSGLGYEQDGHYEMAIASYSKAIEQNPTLAFAYINRGSAYTSMGKFDSAIADYTTAIRLNPGNAKAYSARGKAYARKGEFSSAIADYDQAIVLNPRSPEFYNSRAAMYERVGQIDYVIKDYRAALAIDPASSEAKAGLERLGAATN